MNNPSFGWGYFLFKEFDKLRKSSLTKRTVIESAQRVEKEKKNRPKLDGIFIGTACLKNIEPNI